MRWFLSLFQQYRAMEQQLADYRERAARAETQAAWAQKHLDDATANEREAWRELATTTKSAADLAAQYGFGRAMFGVGPEVPKRSNDIQKVSGYRNVRDLARAAQDQILEEIEQAEAQLGVDAA